MRKFTVGAPLDRGDLRQCLFCLQDDPTLCHAEDSRSAFQDPLVGLLLGKILRTKNLGRALKIKVY